MHFGGKIPDFDQDHLSGRVKVDYLLLPRWLLGEKTQKPGCNCQGFSKGGLMGYSKYFASSVRIASATCFRRAGLLIRAISRATSTASWGNASALSV